MFVLLTKFSIVLKYLSLNCDKCFTDNIYNNLFVDANQTA